MKYQRKTKTGIEKNPEIEDTMKEESKLILLPGFKQFGLTLRQAKFCQFKVYGYDSTDAARRSGYSVTSASSIGFNLMLNESVKKYIAFLQSQIIYDYGISKNMLIEDLINIKDKCIRDDKPVVAISAIKAIANLIGMDNGKEPNKDTIASKAASIAEQNNFQINFSGASLEETETIKNKLEAKQVIKDESIEELNEFKNDIDSLDGQEYINKRYGDHTDE